MNTRREKLASQHAYMQKHFRSQQASAGLASGFGHLLQESARYVSDFGRQAFLLAGLLLLIAIMAAATSGNQAFADFLRWTGWF